MVSTKTIEKVDVELCATKGRVNAALSTARNSSRSRCCKIRNGDVSVHISFCTPEFAQRPCHSAVSVEEKVLVSAQGYLPLNLREVEGQEEVPEDKDEEEEESEVDEKVKEVREDAQLMHATW